MPTIIGLGDTKKMKKKKKKVHSEHPNNHDMQMLPEWMGEGE